MKNKKIMLSLLAIATIASSCSITKRRYFDGYQVEWHHRDRANETTTTSQKPENSQEDLIETSSVSKDPLSNEEHQPLTTNDLKSSPIKENKASRTNHFDNTIQHHPVPFVKNSLHKATKHVLQVKERSHTKAMAILGTLMYILLCLIVLVLIIFIISLLL
jgi:ABC-type anion transport system duplicated permease subunit